jgi:putative protease
VQFRQGGEQKAFTLKEMKVEGRPAEKVEPDREAVLTAPFDVSPGDLLFRVEAAEVEQEASASPLVKKVQAAGRSAELKPGPALKRVMADLEGTKTRRSGPHRAASSKPQLWYKVSRTEDVAGLAELKPDRVILPLDSANVRRMVNYRRRLGDLFNRIVWSLPPLIFDAGLAALGRDTMQLARMGAREFAIANPGQLALVDREIKGRRGRPTVYADYRVNCLNSQAEAELADMGLAGVTISLEADEANLDALLAKAGRLPRMLYLYGRPALFTSRFRPAGPRENLPVVSPRRERFRIRETRDYVTIFSEQPVFLAPLLKKKALAGVTAYIIDLENDPRPAATARVVHEAVARGKPIGGASRFNYSRGLF